MEENKYEAAHERVKSAIKECGNNVGRIKMIESIFPELKESEDERIREKLIEYFKDLMGGWFPYSNEEIIAWLEKQGKPEDMGEVSDGYHTFNELYYYRMLYNAAFFNRLPKDWVHKSKRHHDGEECFGGGWFIVMANLPTGQISNHYELKDWDLFQIPEKDIADEWDGHTPQEAAERLHKFLLEKQGEKPQGKTALEAIKEEKIDNQNCVTDKVEPNVRHASMEMLYWTKQELIDKACEWLIEHKEAVETEDNGIMGWIPDYFIGDFRRAMEE